MKRALMAGAVLGLLVLPGAATTKPTKGERADAAEECRAEREAVGADAFREKYGTNRNKRNAFGKCVSREMRADAREDRRERRNAAQECRAERGELGGEAFREKYGTNQDKRNAFGKCVSGRVAEEEAEEREKEEPEDDRGERKPDEQCRAERNAIGEQAFAEKYGTNPNKRNAFGKCVSRKD